MRPDGCGRDLFCRVATGVCSITDDEPEREAREAAVQSHKQAPSVRWESLSASLAIFKTGSHSVTQWLC